VIVVLGTPAWRDAEPPQPAGLACEIALVAASRGRRVELVGRIGDDPAGDALLIALARSGVGHAAVLRDATHPTATVPAAPTDPDRPTGDDASPASRRAGGAKLDAEDVSLALSYLTAFSVLVVAPDLPASALPAAIDGASFAGAHLVLLVEPGAPAPGVLPDACTVLAVPDGPEAGALGTVVGVYAEGLDAGLDPARAFRAAIGDWEPADEEPPSPEAA
jgi:ribokinase